MGVCCGELQDKSKIKVKSNAEITLTGFEILSRIELLEFKKNGVISSPTKNQN
jgi:hypothetical protein